MSYEIKIGETNAIPKGTAFFTEKEPVSCICAVIKGRAYSQSDYLKVPFNAGSFIGIPDSVNGRWLTDYVADEGCVIYAFPVKDIDGLRGLLTETNKDYKGLIVSSLAKIYKDLAGVNLRYGVIAKKLYSVLSENNAKYVAACKNGGMAVADIAGLSELAPYTEDENAEEVNKEYIFELAAIPSAVMKSFFGDTNEVVMDNVEKISYATLVLLERVLSVGEYIYDKYSLLYNDGDQNLLSTAVRLSLELDKAGRPDKSLAGICTDMAESFKSFEKVAVEYMGAAVPVNPARFRKVCAALTNGVGLEEASENSAAGNEDIYRSLKNSLRTILVYGKVDEELSKHFEDLINKFVDLNERLSANDEERKIRHDIATDFYKVYRAVFFETLNGTKIPRPVQLFLDYGFTDERLLSKEQALELCHLDVKTNGNYFCNIYTMSEWLTAIYNGQREPSKNEFDLEYGEQLRELLKTREIDEAEAKKRQSDIVRKTEYEIFNMFKYANRVVSGSLSTFVPVLCDEQIAGSLRGSLVTKDRMGQLVEKYRELDFGVFRRELLYANKELGIEKETIQLEVKQDIILLPIFGSNAIMWQDISCKHRDSAGRFLFPILKEGHLEEDLVKQLGRFRWELCKTMQGTAWNNVQVKSLTSEFSDYIQYYRKNRDLTDDKKEKIKMQLIKGKNNAREVFVQDYEQWIKFESQGGMKLNKVSREILAAYCPFNKTVRTALESQPSFAEAVAKYNREAAKKTREVELRIHALGKNKIEPPQVIMDTLKFYKEM